MGNCISHRNKSTDTADEEKNGLIPEPVTGSQEAALVLANERLRAGDPELLATREEVRRLREALLGVEKDNVVLKGEMDEQTAELSVAHGQLVVTKNALKVAKDEVVQLGEEKRGVCSELDSCGKQLEEYEGALDRAREEINRLGKDIERRDAQHGCLEAVKNAEFDDLKRQIDNQGEEILVYRDTIERTNGQRAELEAVLAHAETQIKTLKQTTLWCAEDMRHTGRLGGSFRRSTPDQKTIDAREKLLRGIFGEARPMIGGPQHSILQALDGAKEALAKEMWIAGWIGEQYGWKAKAAERRVRDLRQLLEDEKVKRRCENEQMLETISGLREHNRSLMNELAKLKSQKQNSPGPESTSTQSTTSGRTYEEAYRFSTTVDKDLRVGVGWWRSECRVDIREFYSGRHSPKVRRAHPECIS